jgi:hypothetical protein
MREQSRACNLSGRVSFVVLPFPQQRLRKPVKPIGAVFTS